MCVGCQIFHSGYHWFRNRQPVLMEVIMGITDHVITRIMNIYLRSRFIMKLIRAKMIRLIRARSITHSGSPKGKRLEIDSKLIYIIYGFSNELKVSICYDS